MKKVQAQRQIWIIVFIAVVGYFWLKSSTPDRYGKVPLDSGAAATLPTPTLLQEPARSRWPLYERNDRLTYEEQNSGDRIVILRTADIDTVTTVIDWHSVSSGHVSASARLQHGFDPLSLELTRASGLRFGMSTHGDTVHVWRGDSTGDQIAMKRRPGLLFEELLLVQLPYWRGLTDTVQTAMAAFAVDGSPLRVYDVTLAPEGDSALTLRVGSDQEARAVFSPAKPWVHRLCTPDHRCYELRDASGAFE